MKNSLINSAVVSALSIASFASIASATTVLYSQNFETGYVLGSVVGQGSPAWESSQQPGPLDLTQTSAAAQIQSTIANPGNALRIESGGVGRQTTYWQNLAINQDLAGQTDVRVSFDLFRAAPVLPGGQVTSTIFTGGLFNATAFPIFQFGMDDFGQLAVVTSGGIFSISQSIIPYNQWNTLLAKANFVTRTVTFEINSSAVDLAPVAFNTGTGSFVGDMDIQFIPEFPPAISDIAYFDNLLVTIPEPATLGVVAGLSMLALRRRAR